MRKTSLFSKQLAKTKLCQLRCGQLEKSVVNESGDLRSGRFCKNAYNRLSRPLEQSKPIKWLSAF